MTIDTEQYIREAAARGWSKSQTCEALGLNRGTFWAMLKAMPALDWAPKGCTLGNKLGNASRKPAGPAVFAGLARARAARRDKSLITWGGRTGTIAELAAYSQASETTIRRRLRAGESVDRAFGTPVIHTTPAAGWRSAENRV